MGIPTHTTEKPSTSDTQISDPIMSGAEVPPPAAEQQGRPEGTKSEAELAAEKLYEERMEEEYAKREGGA